VKMQYYSASSRQTKDYLVEPYRLAYAQGGMYLLAQVPKYRQLRTFAVERIKSLSVTGETFEAVESANADPFPNSLGVNSGPPERIQIEFAPEAAVHVRERTWHPSSTDQRKIRRVAWAQPECVQRLGIAKLDPQLRAACPRCLTDCTR